MNNATICFLMFVAWYLVGAVSMSYWLVKANKRYGFSKTAIIRKHNRYVLWTAILGPVAFAAGYIGYQFSRME